jgi:hypothetical protein
MLAEAKAKGHTDPETIKAGMNLAGRIARGLQRLK